MNTLKIEIPDGFEISEFNRETGVVSFKAIVEDIKDRVKTVEDACKILGEEDSEVISHKILIESKVAEHIIANQALVVVIKALNEGWVPDWENGKYDKWINWFNLSSSSSGRFSFYDSAEWLSVSNVGSRLCFRSKELADYAAEQFLYLYEKAFTI